MIIAGWKACSLIDVHRAVSFTLWLCGCNLKCPFCHNWRVAEAYASVCREILVDEIVEELAIAKAYVDYIHATGGEPLLQHMELRRLFIDAKNLGVKTSVNSNLTMPDKLAVIIDVLDHVASDAKIPELMYGVPNWQDLYAKFLESLRVLGEHGVQLELRIPLARAGVEDYMRVINEVLSRVSNLYVVINPIVCEPTVFPRDQVWCSKHALTENEYVELAEKIADYIMEHGVKTFILRRVSL